MCDALEVSASGYYAWAARPDSPTEQWRQRLVGAIEEVHAEVRQRYGSPRMTAELRARGYECSENTVARLMSAHGIKARAPRRFIRTTDSDHRLPVAANLLGRDFDPERPNQAWGADITYIPTHEGWLYLAVVEDLFSRMVVGWAMAEGMESRLVVDALEMAVARRRPEAGLVAHSDRGSQYASDHYQRVLASEGTTCSMSGVGQCWDNAPVESLWHAAATDRVKAAAHTRTCQTVPGEHLRRPAGRRTAADSQATRTTRRCRVAAAGRRGIDWGAGRMGGLRERWRGNLHSQPNPCVPLLHPPNLKPLNLLC